MLQPRAATQQEIIKNCKTAECIVLKGRFLLPLKSSFQSETKVRQRQFSLSTTGRLSSALYDSNVTIILIQKAMDGFSLRQYRELVVYARNCEERAQKYVHSKRKSVPHNATSFTYLETRVPRPLCLFVFPSTRDYRYVFNSLRIR
jgi:hypothetical protein